jgi:protease-4
MKSFLKYLLVLLSGFFILFFVLFLIILSFSPSEPKVSDNSYLYLSIGGSIPEYTAPNDFEEFTGDVRLDLQKIRDNLEKAAVDRRINGVILNLNFIQCGYAKINEIQSYIKKYKESGKKIYAFLDLGLTKEYLIAIACDSIFMPPTSNLFLTGITAGVTFYKGFFDKIGIEADFVHIGKYKNAPDTYTRNTMSGFQRDVLDDILNQFYKNLINSISTYRNLPASTIENLINNISGFTAGEALDNGLIDGTLYKDELVELLNFNNKLPSKINGTTYSLIPASSLNIRTKSRIAVIHISGTIAEGNDTDDVLFGKLAGSSTIVNNINEAADSKSIKAIIIRIDSPGGSAIASDHIWKAVSEATKKKPVIASISDYGASGGYYIALGADTLLANEMSLVGSIGIFAGKFSAEKLYDKIGLNYETLTRGKNAELFSTNHLWSASQKAIVQKLIYEFYINFVTKVADSRQMTYNDAKKFSEGRVWSGYQSLNYGLSDSIGNFYDAIALAKVMANIDPAESVRMNYYPKKKDFFSELYNFIEAKGEFLNLIHKNNFSFLTKIQVQPLMLMPFIIEWN